MTIAGDSSLPTVEEVTSEIAAKRDELIDLAAELVRIPTVIGEETPAQLVIEKRLKKAGFEVNRVTPDRRAAEKDPAAGYPWLSYDERFSVVGRLKGTGEGPSLHLNGHVDVVPVEEEGAWTYGPWDGVIDSGRLWGRGAADMKAGLAACLVAAETLASLSSRWPGDLIVSSVIEEECTGNGMWSLVQEGYIGDATLIGESTDLFIDHGGTGVVWIRLVAHGTPGHAMVASSRGAFDQLSAAFAALRDLESARNSPPRDRAFAAVSDWPFSMSVGAVEGGVWTASTPAEIAARVRVGFGRDTDPSTVQSEIVGAVASATDNVEVRFEGFRAPAYWHRPEGEFFDALSVAHQRVIGSDAKTSVGTGTTDARYQDDPCFCYGPRAGNLHGVDEWVDLESLEQTAIVIALTGAGWIGSRTVDAIDD